MKNTTQTRGRHDNRRRNHYARLLVNIGRKRISRNSQHPIPPCSSDNGQTPNVSIVSPTSELSSRIGETALAFTLLYIGNSSKWMRKYDLHEFRNLWQVPLDFTTDVIFPNTS
ncbi:hypothetical protein OUZ56_020408 [Daphnia magna]|uniref:Uncharacterized protein n=1 Tax=Daphnia magna TaxID=35525 RepID=A0ABQ9ZEE4_9CRUS|nr:hypothetical protein OUZ56_020408 [Daphnia magna]